MKTVIEKRKRTKIITDEFPAFKRLITEIYPSGPISIVSDTFDLWSILTDILPRLKTEIMSRDGKVIIRPDSGDPVDIITGTGAKAIIIPDDAENIEAWIADMILDDVAEHTPHGECGPEEYEMLFKHKNEYFYGGVDNIEWNRHDKQFYFIEMYGEPHVNKRIVTSEELPAIKGVIELLWDEFGGTINDKGFKELDSHIGAIYGDSITIQRSEAIMQRLSDKGFASTNVVFGIGSFTYQYNTRDTFGFAMKATYGELNVDGKIESRNIFKDPITDDGLKKSAKGLVAPFLNSDGQYELKDQLTWDEFFKSDFKNVYRDGKLLIDYTLEEIRENLKLKNY